MLCTFIAKIHVVLFTSYACLSKRLMAQKKKKKLCQVNCLSQYYKGEGIITSSFLNNLTWIRNFRIMFLPLVCQNSELTPRLSLSD